MLSDRNDVTFKPNRRACWFATQVDLQDTGYELKANEMIRSIHGRVAPGGVGFQMILSETSPNVVAGSLKRDKDARVQVATYGPSILFYTGDHINRPFKSELSSLIAGPANVREVMSARPLFASQISRLFADPRFLTVEDAIAALGPLGCCAQCGLLQAMSFRDDPVR